MFFGGGLFVCLFVLGFFSMFVSRVPMSPFHLSSGPDFAHPVLVKTAVTSLALVGAGFQFPPINWSVSLSPLMRLGFGKIDHSCLYNP